jgi:two-component system, sensor histidine kinase
MLNKLLLRQVQKYFERLDKIPENMMPLFRAISDSYDHYEKDRKLIERSIEISSEEMIELNSNLRREQEELSKTYRELERKNQELEQFAYVASHDLQEPLRTICSFVQLLENQYKSKLDERADKYLNHISQSTTRMGILIKDLLDFSRIGKSKSFEVIDCNIILHEVLADLELMINEVQADIIVESLPVIRGYRTEIKQLFQNLITNGIKFRKKDMFPEIRIAAQDMNKYWKFSFADNGIGIEKEHFDKIFVIFQRLHNRSQYEGSGIGLAHCKKIVELHNGGIGLESVPGEGSTFFFTIPGVIA